MCKPAAIQEFEKVVGGHGTGGVDGWPVACHHKTSTGGVVAVELRSELQLEIEMTVRHPSPAPFGQLNHVLQAMPRGSC
jgi:hypothetical protein